LSLWPSRFGCDNLISGC